MLFLNNFVLVVFWYRADPVICCLVSQGITIKIKEKLTFCVFVSLNSFSCVLSMIFGILGKFRIDIDKNIFSKLFFSNKKKSWKKSSFKKKNRFFDEKIFSIEMSMKIDFLKNRFSFTFQWKNIFSSKNLKLDFFQDFFFISKKKFRKNIFIYVDPKFPQDSKNHT